MKKARPTRRQFLGSALIAATSLALPVKPRSWVPPPNSLVFEASDRTVDGRDLELINRAGEVRLYRCTVKINADLDFSWKRLDVQDCAFYTHLTSVYGSTGSIVGNHFIGGIGKF